MPRNMSFSRTTRQIRDRGKTVTRRKGGAHLKPGERFWAVEKAMGLRPGEKIQRLALLECVSNRPLPLWQIDAADVALEGFGEMHSADFVLMFVRYMGGTIFDTVNRIEFKYVDVGQAKGGA